MKRIAPVLTATFLLGTTVLFGQAPTPATDNTKANTRTRAEAKATDKDATYGRVKELTAGQKVVIDVDNAVDKSFDLNDKDLKVTLAKGLKVGDPVKVVEHEKLGKTTSVSITKHSGGGAAHGDKDPAAKKP
jgi:hypothetical protein